MTGAACGGGGGSSAPAGVSATATPNSGALGTSSTASTNVTIGGGPADLFLAPIAAPAGTVSGSVGFGNATSGSGTVAATLSAANPSSVTPASMQRRPASIDASPVNPIAYLRLHFSAADAFATPPSIAFTVPVGASAPNGWWIASLDENNSAAGWNNPVEGSSNGAVPSFPASAFGFTIGAADTYDFVLFAPGGTYPTPSITPSASPSPVSSASPSATASPSSVPTASPSPSPSATPLAFTCNDAGFIADQTAFAAKSITADQPVDVCGTVAAVTAQTNTSGSNTHGYWYITIPEGASSYNIEIVSNLTAMAEASTSQPPAWPWVTVGQYAHVRGRYYYDNANSQGIDWTEDDTSNSWPQLGFVNICDAAVTTCVKYW